MGGNAAGLFPTINPSSSVPSSSPASGTRPSRDPHAETAADASALAIPVTGAQIAGLAALAVAFGLAVTRVSVRRRHAPEQPPKD
jgi:hypothetical protein